MIGFINLFREHLNFERLELDSKSIHDIASLLVKKKLGMMCLQLLIPEVK